MSIAYSKYFVMASIALTLTATDIYLPAMPLMVDSLDTTSNIIQYSISCYLLALAIMALFYGPLSDAIGRRKTYLIGQFIFLASSLALITTNSIELLLLFRFLQGCGAASSSISAAVVSDIYDDKESGKIIAQMAAVIVLSPAIAPIIGGYITTYLGWRFCFVFMALFVGILWTGFYLYFKETKDIEQRNIFRPHQILRGYLSALKRPAFLSYVVLHSLPSCSLWCLISTQPFVFIESMGVKVENYGYYIMALIAVNSSTSFLVQRIITRTGPIALIRIGILSVYTASLLLLLVTLSAPTSPTLATIAILPMMFAMPMLFPTGVSKALSYVRDISGTGSAMIAFTRQCFGFLGSIVAGFLTDITLLPTALFMGFIATMILILYIIARRFERIGALEYQTVSRK